MTLLPAADAAGIGETLTMSKTALREIQESTRPCTVALLGNPNTGKSTLFNALTGYHQRVGNYPGVTVETRTGQLRGTAADRMIDLIDLPGTYSFGANSADEAIVLDVLLGRQVGAPLPDVMVVVVDAANLTRNLFLTSQLLELDRPLVVALNMIDVAEAAGVHIDVDKLRAALGVPVVSVVATKQVGVDSLRRAIEDAIDGPTPRPRVSLPVCVRDEVDDFVRRAATTGGNGAADRLSHAEALQTLLHPGGYHERRWLADGRSADVQDLARRRERITAAGASLVEVEAQTRYAWIGDVVRRVTRRTRTRDRSRSDVADRLLTHRVAGLGVFVLLMAVCFQAIYTWAEPLMNGIDGAVGAAGGLAAGVLPEGPLQSLLRDGVIAGVGAVLTFLPQIAILFLFIAILEDCGYMARAAFLLHRWMGLLGLSGKSFIPLLSSFACAVPGIMATRTIEDRRDRFVTMMIAPLMSCSARLPVYVLLIGAFIPATALLGGLVNLQALTLLALYFVGVVVAIPVALLLKKTVFRGETPSFLMELPTYKWPSTRTVLYRVYEQVREFCVSAGTIIFAVAIVIWALGYYPRPVSISTRFDGQRAEANAAYESELVDIAADDASGATPDSLTADASVRAALAEIRAAMPAAARPAARGAMVDGHGATVDADAGAGFSERLRATAARFGPAGEVASRVWLAQRRRDRRVAQLDHDEAGALLRASFLGRMGRWIEPLVEPIGWDWRIGTAVIAAFPAREVVIATMGTIYNLGSEQDETSVGLRQRLQEARRPDGRPLYTIPVALSIMVFFALCCQCGATLATIRRETRSWRWPIMTFTYMTTLAYVAALAVYHVSSHFV